MTDTMWLCHEREVANTRGSKIVGTRPLDSIPFQQPQAQEHHCCCVYLYLVTFYHRETDDMIEVVIYIKVRATPD